MVRMGRRTGEVNPVHNGTGQRLKQTGQSPMSRVEVVYMANPISAAYQAQQATAVDQTAQVNTPAKPVGNKPAPPQDTVTISPAAQAANQAQQAQAAQTQQTGAGANHGGK